MVRSLEGQKENPVILKLAAVRIEELRQVNGLALC